MNKVRTYRAVNLKSIFTIFSLVLLFSLPLFCLWIAIISGVLWLIISTALISLVIPIMFYYVLFSKVYLTETTVIKKTLFGEMKMDYKDIKSFGVFTMPDRTPLKLAENEIYKTVYLQSKIVYVANQSDYLASSFNQKGSVKFHLVDDIYEVIKQRVNGIDKAEPTSA